MKTGTAGQLAHPGPETLTLYSSGDLPWISYIRTWLHVKRCPRCEREVYLFRDARQEIKRGADTENLSAFEAIANWAQLEREMIGNIAVGVAAGRCIDKVPRHRHMLSSRGIWVAALLTILFIVGWYTHIPREQRDHLISSLERLGGGQQPQMAGPVVRTTPVGITVHAHGATLTLLHPIAARVSLSGDSAVTASYVDEETGEVTVTNVYGQ